MSAGKKKSPPKEKPASALSVNRGVEGSHDGLPGGGRGKAASRAPRKMLSTEDYVQGVLSGDRTLLGRAITLIESNAPAHQQQAQKVLSLLLPHTGGSVRLGISGVPGAGKSTLIETMGKHLTARGHKVAVTAVDPSSTLTRGSILGDKTRMEELARDEHAFIRPSPSGGTLGGVARKTRETMLLFEAAGFDVLIVETIGVGQNEITVRGMVDFYLLVLIAGAGDELQGIKRGVIEMADCIAVNKADGDNFRAAQRARSEYEHALHFLPPATEGWTTPAVACSAAKREGIEEIWKLVESFMTHTRQSGELQRRRQEQSLQWLHSMVDERLHQAFYRHEKVQAIQSKLEEEVRAQRIPATQAAWELLRAAGFDPQDNS